MLVGDMTRTKFGGKLAAICVLALAAIAGTQLSLAAGSAQPEDQQRAFDFLVGTWRTHVLSLVTTAWGASQWIEMNGTVIDQPLWNGRASVEKFEASGAGNHLQGLTLYLYDPLTGQWSLRYASSSDGIMDEPQYGEFKNGRGVFYGWRSGDAGVKRVLVRAIWSNTTANSSHYEIASSADGGKTWTKEFIAQLTRLKKEPEYDTAYAPGSGPEHDYDFNMGHWKTQIRAVGNPLSAPGVWTNLRGTHVVYRVWGDWANIGQLEIDGPGGHSESLELRMYDRKTRQWRVYLANSNNGALDGPMIGGFKDGVGTFVFLDKFLDKMEWKAVLMRKVWFRITSKSCHEDWAISVDGGRTWVPTWISTDTLGG
jgi:hypothetical protein